MSARHFTLVVLLVTAASTYVSAAWASEDTSMEGHAQVGLETEPGASEPTTPADQAPSVDGAEPPPSPPPQTPAARAAATAGTAVSDVGSAVHRSADAARRDTVLRLTAESSFIGPTGPDRELFGEVAPASTAYGISVRRGMWEGGARLVDTPWYSMGGVQPSTSVRSWGGDATGRFFLPVEWPVMPYLAASAGIRRGSVEVSDSRGKATDSAVAWTASGSVGAQIEFGTERVRFGLFMDHGYRWHSGLAFDDARFNRSEARPIDLGTLDVQGYEGRFGLQLGFAL